MWFSTVLLYGLLYQSSFVFISFSNLDLSPSGKHRPLAWTALSRLSAHISLSWIWRYVQVESRWVDAFNDFSLARPPRCWLFNLQQLTRSNRTYLIKVLSVLVPIGYALFRFASNLLLFPHSANIYRQPVHLHSCFCIFGSSFFHGILAFKLSRQKHSKSQRCEFSFHPTLSTVPAHQKVNFCKQVFLGSNELPTLLKNSPQEVPATGKQKVVLHCLVHIHVSVRNVFFREACAISFCLETISRSSNKWSDWNWDTEMGPFDFFIRLLHKFCLAALRSEMS